MIDRQHGWNTSFKPLFIGVTLSLLMSLAAYLIVDRHHLPKAILDNILIALCFTQVIFQLFFFLHVGIESKPHWNMITFLFLVLVLIVIMGGSLWIMHNLKYNVMPKM